MADVFTRSALAGKYVKPANDHVSEAENQLSAWLLASLRKKMQLARWT